MQPEEQLIIVSEGVPDEEDEYGVHGPLAEYVRAREEARLRNRPVVERFLGKGKRADAMVDVPGYYAELLAWALNRQLRIGGWEIVRTIGHQKAAPQYRDVKTGTGEEECENLLVDGHHLIRRGETRFAITVDAGTIWKGSIHVEGAAKRRRELKEFVESLRTAVKEQNFYRRKHLQFDEKLRFLKIAPRAWESIVLNPESKREIRLNSVDFFKGKARWKEYGIPLRRGILLSGEPGTGKTAICKALMTEAKGITCIVTDAYSMAKDEYVSELYEIAQDLSPTIVFVEDIDLIARDRMEASQAGGAPLFSLLSAMDGLEEQEEIITVATTNCLEMLDKALSERPSRFDRVIRIPRPVLDDRREMVKSLCRKIPLDAATQDYIIRKTEKCTPAQVQEIVFGLVIGSGDSPPQGLKFTTTDIDRVIGSIRGTPVNDLGFTVPHRFKCDGRGTPA